MTTTRRLLSASVFAGFVAACQGPTPPPLEAVHYGEILLRLEGRDIRAHFSIDSAIGLYDSTAHRVIVTGSTAPGPAAPDYFGLWLEPYSGASTYTLGPSESLNSLTFFIELSPGSDTGSRIIFETDPNTQATATVNLWNPLTSEIRGNFSGQVRQGSAGDYPVEGAFWGRLLDNTVPRGACP